MSSVLVRSPAQVGINGVDLTDDGEDYDSNMLDGSGDFAFQAIVTIAEAGTDTDGLAALTLLLYDDDDALIATVPLVTAINTKTDGNQCICVFGGGVTGSVAAGSGMTGTVATDIDKIKVVGKFKLRLTVSEDHVGDSCTATVYLMSQRS